MDTLQSLMNILLHIDVYLNVLVTNYGSIVYFLLFMVIFCETGLVIMPFLPGDSLIFSAGALAAASNNNLSIQLLFIVLLIASILGNKVNYIVGRFIGPKVFKAKQSWFFNKKHLEKAHAFYQQHGGKTIIFARFIPIIRTFVPFVAGAAAMQIHRFSFYNIISAIIWIGSLLSAGYYLGSLPWVSKNFSLVIYTIIALSILPPLLSFIYHKGKAIFVKSANNMQ